MNRYLWLCVLILAVIAVGPILDHRDPLATQPALSLLAPSPEHPLGTDSLGRDVLSRFLHGGWRTLMRAALSLVLIVIVGGGLGGLMAIGPHWFDEFALIAVNGLLALPGIVNALLWISILGQGENALIMAIAFAQIAAFSIFTRTLVRNMMASDYLLPAYALGATRWRLFWRHIVPNILPVFVGYCGIVFGYCVLNGAALGFLGVGGDLSAPEWGAMLYEGRQYLRIAPWIGIFPGLGISVLVWAVTSLGEALTRRG